MNASEILTAAVTTLDQRGKEYDPSAAEKKDAPWKPKSGKTYYFLDSDGFSDDAVKGRSPSRDRVRVAFGNCFRTREEAEAKRAEIFS